MGGTDVSCGPALPVSHSPAWAHSPVLLSVLVMQSRGGERTRIRAQVFVRMSTYLRPSSQNWTVSGLTEPGEAGFLIQYQGIASGRERVRRCGGLTLSVDRGGLVGGGLEAVEELLHGPLARRPNAQLVHGRDERAIRFSSNRDHGW